MHFNKVLPMGLLSKRALEAEEEEFSQQFWFWRYIFNSFIFHVEFYFKDKHALHMI